MAAVFDTFETTLRAATDTLARAAGDAAEALDDAGARTDHGLDREDERAVDCAGRASLTSSERAALLREGSEAAIAAAQARLADDLLPPLEDALATLGEHALPGLAQSLEAASEALGLGLEVVGSMAAFAPPLDWAQGVVGTINELLEAMNLGL